MKKNSVKILFFVAVFLSAFVVWYSPIIFKGYAPYKVSEQIILAKNLHKSNFYSMESEKNVFLSSFIINEGGHLANTGNKLTTYLYFGLFSVTGVLDINDLLIFSIILNSLTLLIFSFIVYRMFGIGVSSVFSIFYILIPYNWQQIYSVGVYGFAVFFISLFFLLFFLWRENSKKWVYLFGAGVALSLASLSREVFFLLIPVFFVYLFFPLKVGNEVSLVSLFRWSVKKLRLILPALVPVILILSVFYIPSFIGKDGGNYYFNLFSSDAASNQEFGDFNNYGHLYPDPYIYLFERESFLENYTNKIGQSGFLESIQMKKVLMNLGEGSLSIAERGFLGIVLFTTHLMRFTSFGDVGGPFVLFFLLFGLIYLYEKDKGFYDFLLSWIFGVLFLLSFVVLVSRNHLRDFNWLIPLLLALGVLFLGKILSGSFGFSDIKKVVVVFILTILVSYNLLLANHTMFGKSYDSDRQLKLEVYAKVFKEKEVPDYEVISLGLNSGDQVILNYLADKTTVVLSEKTIKKLIKEERLQEVFSFFGVKHILGYGDELSQAIVDLTNTQNIASSSIQVQKQPVSPLRSLVMNLIK